MNGKLISVEGIEGAGKSTQLAFIAEYLKDRGKQVIITREPGGTKLGEQLRELVLKPCTDGMATDTELLIMFAARAEHIKQVIKPAIDRGDWVLTDRFVDATFAYQGGGRGVSTARIQQLSDWTLNDLQTDITFLFDVPVEIGQQRIMGRKGELDRFEQEKVEFFQKIRNCYLERGKQEKKRIQVIDASKSINDIQAQLSTILIKLTAQ